MSKYAGIDLLKLYSGTEKLFSDDMIKISGNHDVGETTLAKADVSKSSQAFNSHAKWNGWLTQCLDKNNMSELISVRYRLQVGMNELAKQKLNTPEIAQMFVRWVASIEKTARKIIKKQHPIPQGLEHSDMVKWANLKKQRDTDFETFLRKSSF